MEKTTECGACSCYHAGHQRRSVGGSKVANNLLKNIHLQCLPLKFFSNLFFVKLYFFVFDFMRLCGCFF